MVLKPFRKVYPDSGYEKDEYSLWSQFKLGDKAAYAYFYETYSVLLFRYGCKVHQDRDLVKDCVHDLFTEIWKNKENLSSPVSVKNYLVKSLRNKLTRATNKKSRFVDQDSVPENLLGYSESMETSMVLAETKREGDKKLIKALRTLSNKQKEVIFLLYYNNVSPAEAASIMSVSVRTIYNTAFNAMQSLKAEMVVLMFFILTQYSSY